MKLEKLKYILLSSVVILSACYDDYDDDPNVIHPKFENSADVTVGNVVNSNYDLTNLDNTSIEFDLGLSGLDVQKVNIYQSYNNGARSLVSELTAVPATVTVSLDDAIALVSPVVKADLVPGESFLYSFELVLASGDIIQSGKLINASTACPTSIPLGTWTNVTSGGLCLTYKSGGGEVELTSLGGLRYEISNFDFGFYGITTRAQFNDVCNTLNLGGATESGISWTGEGVYTPNGGVNGKGRLEFPCHFDATYNPGYPEDLVFDKN